MTRSGVEAYQVRRRRRLAERVQAPAPFLDPRPPAGEAQE